VSKRIFVSASQIENYRSCTRRWWFRSVKKIAEPQSVAQQFGDRFSKAIEARLKGDIIPLFDEVTDATISRFLDSATAYFPVEPNPNIFAEKKIQFNLDDVNATMVGYIDVLDLSGPNAHIRDHKTRSDKKYAPSHTDLTSDLQLNIYAYAIRHELAKDLLVDSTIGHINYIKPPKARAHDLDYLRTEWQPEVFLRQVPIDSENNDAIMAVVKTDVEVMHRYADSLLPAEQVPYDTTSKACFKYGQSCPYTAICPKLSFVRNKMALKTAPPPLKTTPTAAPAPRVAPPPPARPVAPPPVATEPTAAPAPAPRVAPPPPPKAASAPRVAPPPPTAATNPPAPPLPPIQPFYNNGINPPVDPFEFPPTDHEENDFAPMPSVDIDRIPNITPKIKKKLAEMGFRVSTEIAHVTEQYLSTLKLPPATAREILQAAVTLRGLHAITEPNPFEVLAHIGLVAQEAERPLTPQEMSADLPNIPGAPPLASTPPSLTTEPAPAEKSACASSFNVYLECVPIKGVKYTVLEDWLDPIFTAMEAEAGVKDWRSIMEYGRAAEMLHVAVRNIIEGRSNFTVPEHIVVLSSYSEYAKVLMDLLIRYANVVVKK
jgi:hypothetical protein